jgi:hypothetical protein
MCIRDRSKGKDVETTTKTFLEGVLSN